VASAVAPARTVYNSDFAQGLGTSIACGVRALPEGSHVLIVLGDMPGLRADVVRVLVGGAGAGRIVVPRYLADPDTPGHPVLFGAGFRPELERLAGDAGARSVVEAHPESVLRVDVPGALGDIDSP
jgi:molybdenum cofactor cytidylyltransferase